MYLERDLDQILGLKIMIINGLNENNEWRWYLETNYSICQRRTMGWWIYSRNRSSKKFNVNITKFNFEKYFYAEGDWILLDILDLILKRKKKIKKKITLGDLERGVKEGKLV